MKTLISTLFLILAVFFNSIGGQEEELPPIRTFQFRPVIHVYMAHLMRKVNGEITTFDAFTTLVARGATLIGWLNHKNVIEPIFIRNVLVTYNLDEQVPLVATMTQLEAYGVYAALPVGPRPLDPIRTFLYRPKIHTYLAHLRKKVNAQEEKFDEHTILVARGANLFGWLNIENIIEPIFLQKHAAMYNLDEHMPSRSNIGELISYGLFNELSVGPSEIPPPVQSRSRSTSRSPQKRYRSDTKSSSPRYRSRSPPIWQQRDAESSARATSL